MKVQYITNKKGNITDVQIPIREWELLKSKYPDIESINAGLPDWQKEMIDTRLRSIEEDQSRLLSIDSLMNELLDIDESYNQVKVEVT